MPPPPHQDTELTSAWQSLVDEPSVVLEATGPLCHDTWVSQQTLDEEGHALARELGQFCGLWPCWEGS